MKISVIHIYIQIIQTAYNKVMCLHALSSEAAVKNRKNEPLLLMGAPTFPSKTMDAASITLLLRRELCQSENSFTIPLFNPYRKGISSAVIVQLLLPHHFTCRNLLAKLVTLLIYFPIYAKSKITR
ncbi:hypothetical protein CDQ83_07400 [Clostridium thermosuccinogenes]|nr:hypothetical protein CDO33_05570 [Pseudoclostridium thermosuccinogenes]PNT93332.1 hypothetical protein CDQ83_07400 [Pseudoclostridium thermosuccinogenes]